MSGLIADADDTTWSVVSHYLIARKDRAKHRQDVRTQALDSLVTRALHAELLKFLREDRDDSVHEIDFDDE